MWRFVEGWPRFVFQWIVTFFIISTLLSAMKSRVGKLKHVLARADSMVDAVVGDGTSLSEGLWNVIQILIIFGASKVYVGFVYWVVNVIVFILFRYTILTYSIIHGLVVFGCTWPVLLFVLLPVVRKLAWYYLMTYFVVCGGMVFATGIALMSVFMAIWNNTVTRDVRLVIGWV